MFHSKKILGALFAVCLVIPSCTSEVSISKATPTVKAGAGPALPADLFVAAKPTDAKGVKETRAAAKTGADVVVRGIIGGRKHAFVDGRAMMVLTDTSLSPCPEDEGCPTPWDFCCETKETLLENTLTVQVLDAGGAPVKLSLDGVEGLAGTKTVVVRGSISSTEGGVVVDAKQIYLEGS